MVSSVLVELGTSQCVSISNTTQNSITKKASEISEAFFYSKAYKI